MAREKRVLLPLAVAIVACWCLSTAFVGPLGQPRSGVVSGSEVSLRGKSAIAMGGGGEYTGFVPDMQRRTLMNLVVVLATGVPVIVCAGGYLYLFYPNLPPDDGSGVVAGDINGTPVSLKQWLSTHKAGERELVQGLKGDPTYIITETAETIKTFGNNAVCTHLGCTVPWVQSANKYACPCHGSQYDMNGKVIRGPAPLSLALAKVGVNPEGMIVVGAWTDEDFRDGSKPWWV